MAETATFSWLVFLNVVDWMKGVTENPSKPVNDGREEDGESLTNVKNSRRKKT